MHLELVLADRGELPRPRSLAELRADTDFADDLQDNLVAIIPFSGIRFHPAAE